MQTLTNLLLFYLYSKPRLAPPTGVLWPLGGDVVEAIQQWFGVEKPEALFNPWAKHCDLRNHSLMS